MDVLLIRAGVVVDCIRADSLARAQSFFPDCAVAERRGAVGRGWLYDGATFTAPAAAPDALPDKRITPNAFNARFLAPEWAAIDAASQGQGPLAVALRRQLMRMTCATVIDMSDWVTYSGTHALESAGLIAAGRATEILDTPVKSGERPAGGF